MKQLLVELHAGGAFLCAETFPTEEDAMAAARSAIDDGLWQEQTLYSPYSIRRVQVVDAA